MTDNTQIKSKKMLESGLWNKHIILAISLNVIKLWILLYLQYNCNLPVKYKMKKAKQKKKKTQTNLPKVKTKLRKICLYISY